MSEYYCNSSEEERSSDTEYRMECESESDSEEEHHGRGRGRRRRRETKTNAKKKKKKALSFKWREEDEVLVLKQLYEFSGKNATYTEAFYEFVEKKLGSQVSMHQMRNKILGLRTKYLELENGCRNNGCGSHQRKLFALSERIWGAGSVEHDEGFMEYLEEMEIDIDSLEPSCLEFLYRDWEVQKLMYIQVLNNKCKLYAKLRELFVKSLNTSTPIK